MLRNQEKNRLFCRFFQDLQQLIGGRSIHLLRLPDDHDLIAVPIWFETEFVQDLPTLFLIDHRLLVLNAQSLVPVIQIKIMLVQNDLSPGLQEVIAHLVRTHDRKDEMQIRMLQFLKLKTRRTDTATILVRTMGTVQVLRIRQRQLQLTYTRYACKKLRMRDATLTHILTKLALRLFLPYDVFEQQAIRDYRINSLRSASTISAYSASLRYTLPGFIWNVPPKSGPPTYFGARWKWR